MNTTPLSPQPTSFGQLPLPVRKAYFAFSSACMPMRGASPEAAQILAGRLQAEAEAHGVTTETIMDFMVGSARA